MPQLASPLSPEVSPDFTATDFLAQPRDPDLHRELAFERRRDDLGLQIWRRNGAHPESRPPTRTDGERMAAARRTLAARVQAQTTPDVRFRQALRQIERALAEAEPLLSSARAACDRAFDAERDLCARRAAALVALAKDFRSAALDAATIADGAA